MSRDTLTLHVRNVLGIAKADVTLAGITLVAGINAAGKSSLLECCALAMLSETSARGLRNKAEQARALRDGSEAGSITLDYAGGKIRVLYPAAEVEQVGKPNHLGSALGIGRARFLALKPEERAREFAERFSASPTLADLVTWFKAHPGSGLENDDQQEQRTLLWQDIDEQGWDSMAKRVKEYGTKRKGAWEQITKAKWGSAKANLWIAPELVVGEKYDIDEERAALAVIRADIEAVQVQEAVASISRIKLQEDIKAAEGAAETIAGLDAEMTELTTQLHAKRATREAMDIPPDDGSGGAQLCPHCGGRIRTDREKGTGYLILSKAAAPMDPAKLKELRMKAARIDGDAQHLENAVQAKASEKIKLLTTVKGAEAARKQLAETADAQPVDRGRLSELRDAALAKERLLGGLERSVQAYEIFRDWQRNAVLLEGLEPEGVRRTVLDRHLSAVNVELGKIAETAAFRTIELTPELEARYDGRPYILISESERWRVDFCLAVLLHRKEDACALVLDRFDVIVPQDRGGIMIALKKLKITALVAMSAKERGAVPNLSKANMGAALWVEDGVVGACH